MQNLRRPRAARTLGTDAAERIADDEFLFDDLVGNVNAQQLKDLSIRLRQSRDEAKSGS